MKAKTILFPAVALALGVAIAWPLLRGEPGAPAGTPAGAAPGQPMRAAAGEPEVPVDQAPDRRSVPLAAADAAAGEPAPDATRPTFKGRVLDQDSRPVAGVPVHLATAADRAESDAEGAFELPVPDETNELRADAPGLATVLAGVVDRHITQQEVEPVVVVAPRIDVAGLIVDRTGRPLDGARVEYVLPEGFRARFGRVLDFSKPTYLASLSADGGRFAIAGLGAVRGARLSARMDGYLPAGIELDELRRQASAVRIVLERPEPVDGSLQGLVLDADGYPAPDARVSLGSAETTAGADGRFVLPLDKAGKALNLTAMKRGQQPARRVITAEERASRAGTPAFVTLELGPPPLAIEGRIVDADGEPIQGAKLWAKEPTVFGTIGGSLCSVEGYLAGAMTDDELRAKFIVDGEPIMPIERILGENPRAGWGWVRTADDGHFVLGGLLDRPYTLSVLRPDSLARSDVGPFQAGASGLRIELPAARLHPLVAGRVVSKDGTGVPGVQVRAMCDAMRLPHETGGYSTSHQTAGNATTDADGRFELRDVAAEAVYLRLDGDRILPIEYGRGVDGGITAVDGAPADALRIEVALRLHVRVDLDDPARADQVAMLDADGNETMINVFVGNGRRTTMRVPFHEGRTDVLAVTDRVVTLALYKDGTRIETAPLALTPGDVNIVRR